MEKDTKRSAPRLRVVLSLYSQIMEPNGILDKSSPVRHHYFQMCTARYFSIADPALTLLCYL